MKVLRLLSVMLCYVSFLSIGAFASEDLSQKARQALSAGHIDEATNLLHQQVKNNPRDYQAWFLLGVSQSKMQRYHPAIESFRRVIELRSDLAEPHNNLAVIYNELGDVPAAIKELEASLKKHPDYLIAEENIADLYIKMALNYYKKALEKTDDQALQMRYGRLLKVRDPANVGEQAVSSPVVAANKPFIKTPVSKAVNVAMAKREKPAIPTVESTTVAVGEGLKSKKSPMLMRLDAIKKSVEAWRVAWQSQSLPDYFAAYADNYIPPSKFKNQAAWEAYKARVISNKSFIKVTLSHMQVALTDDQEHARVTFDQDFESNSYKGHDKKELVLKHLDGDTWKIVSENTL
ncbi:MAG: tetratricopeptide repeat protein [Mariprofundaceae bacterium]|nr:tetratricopeptide repeat protein [Mariprofundaceae bacterium]